MIVTFDRDPIGWAHPLYRRRQPARHDPWDFLVPALETVNSLNNMLNLVQQEPRVYQSLASQRENRDREFAIKMDISNFAPNEVQVKMVDNFIVVEGKHEERKDEQGHGFVSRHFVRRYQLPDNVKPETITCNLSSDGILCVSAPLAIEDKKGAERSLPINFTGQPAAVTNGNETPEQQPAQLQPENK